MFYETIADYRIYRLSDLQEAAAWPSKFEAPRSKTLSQGPHSIRHPPDDVGTGGYRTLRAWPWVAGMHLGDEQLVIRDLVANGDFPV